MEYGRIAQTSQVQTPTGSLDICTMRISETAASPSKELYVKFPDGTEKQLTGSGSGAIFTASNGLTKTGANVALGGSLTANTTLNLGAFELAYNGTMIQRGTVGANKIIAAGSYFEYVPLIRTIVSGTSTGAQLNSLASYSIIAGLDLTSGNATDVYTLMMGESVTIAAASQKNNIINSDTVTSIGAATRYWNDMSEDTNYTGSILRSKTSMFNSTLSGDITDSLLIGNNLTLALVSQSIISGTAHSATTGVTSCIITGSTNSSTSASGIFYSSIFGNNNAISSTEFEYNYLNGPANTITNGSITNVARNIMMLTSSTINGASNSLISGTVTATDIDMSILMCGTTGGTTFTGSTSQSIVLGSTLTMDTISNSLLMGDTNSIDTVDNSMVMGDTNSVSDSSYTHVFGNANTIENAQRCIFIGTGLEFQPVATKTGISVMSVGSAAFLAYTTGGTIPQDEYTLYVENIASLTPGAGLKLISPDGLVVKTITIDNAGAIALL